MDPNDRCVIKLTYENLLKSDAKMANDNYFTITNVESFANNLMKILLKLTMKFYIYLRIKKSQEQI